MSVQCIKIEFEEMSKILARESIRNVCEIMCNGMCGMFVKLCAMDCLEYLEIICNGE